MIILFISPQKHTIIIKSPSLLAPLFLWKAFHGEDCVESDVSNRLGVIQNQRPHSIFEEIAQLA